MKRAPIRWTSSASPLAMALAHDVEATSKAAHRERLLASGVRYYGRNQRFSGFTGSPRGLGEGRHKGRDHDSRVAVQFWDLCPNPFRLFTAACSRHASGARCESQRLLAFAPGHSRHPLLCLLLVPSFGPSVIHTLW
jgi:hypothetical protein